LECHDIGIISGSHWNRHTVIPELAQGGPGERGKLRQIFDKFDTDGNGVIDTVEFMPFAKAVGTEMVRAQRGGVYTQGSAISAVYEVREFKDH
jgi:hypothetical protein